MTKFNFTRGAKTPKKSFPMVTRIVTSDHDAYKIYLRGKELQEADGIHNSRVDPKYIDQAKEELNRTN